MDDKNELDKLKLFGNNLKKIRNQKGIHQDELAKSIGVERTTLSAYENGKRGPEFKTLLKILEELECTSDVLFGFRNKYDLTYKSFLTAQLLSELNKEKQNDIYQIVSGLRAYESYITKSKFEPEGKINPNFNNEKRTIEEF